MLQSQSFSIMTSPIQSAIISPEIGFFILVISPFIVAFTSLFQKDKSQSIISQFCNIRPFA